MLDISQEILDKKKVKSFFSKDEFSNDLGITLEDVELGKSVCSLEISNRHKNAEGYLQGGVSYSLGDFAFAVAANSYGKATVTLQSSISYTAPAQSGKITAYASVISRTNKTCTAVVDIKDEKGNRIVYMQVTGYIVGTSLDFAK